MTNEELVTKIKKRIDSAECMLQLWEQNRGIINKIAYRFAGYEDVEDLRQQGFLGLCEAVEKYKPGEGILFITYALFWIRQSIQNYAYRSGAVHIPSEIRSQILKLKRYRISYELENGRCPSDQEVCSGLAWSIKKLIQIQKAELAQEVVSIDFNHSEDDTDKTIGDTLAADINIEKECIEQIDQMGLKNIIWPIVYGLPESYSKVIRLRYEEGLTRKEIGEKLGKEINVIRNLETKAIEELRRLSKKKKLRAYLEEDKESIAYKSGSLGIFNRTWTSSTERAALH